MIACLQGHAGGLPPQDFLEDGEPLLDANCASADSAPIESSSTDAPEPMTGERLRQVIEKVAEYGPNPVGHQIRFELEGVGMTCIYDETHDRMRIIAPIRHYTKVTAAQRDAMMWANFHTTLDARYCVSEDILYAAFMHPLGSLTEDQVLSAVYQVLSLHRTFLGINTALDC